MHKETVEAWRHGILSSRLVSVRISKGRCSGGKGYACRGELIVRELRYAEIDQAAATVGFRQKRRVSSSRWSPETAAA